MAKKIYQIRYYGDGGENQPQGLAGNRLRSGSVFHQFTPIKQMNITSNLTNIRFYLNNSTEPIIMTDTTYNLNVENLADITALSFDTNSIANLNINNGYLIIDLIYDN